MRWFGMTWGGVGQQTVRRQRPPAWVEAAVHDGPVGSDDTPPRGCAWFDSSHELRTGLLVREMRPGPELQLLLWTQAPQ